MSRDYRFTIPAEGQGQRLDRFLGGMISEVSREKIKRAIHDGQCRVQGLAVTAPGTRLTAGQEITLVLSLPPTGIVPEDGDIAVLWRDEHMLVLNKAAGITVHPCPSCPQGTLVQRLASHFPQLARQEGQRPGIVHRLDKDTSGLLVVALTEEARLRLSALFAAREISKEYLALVHGVPPLEGEIKEPLGRHPLARVKMAIVPENRGGKPAHSCWRVLWAHPQGTFSLVCVRIFTGRTHQIRVHMTHAGFPLWGDTLYGGSGGHAATPGGQAPRPDPAPRQMLHAWKLSLPHPLSGEALSFTCPPPPDMLSTALALARRMRRVVLTGLPGCGKSSLLHRLAARGVPTWSADAVVAKLYAPGAEAHRFLLDRFGARFVPTPRQPVDRAALRSGMAEDPCLRQEVEAAVHALVRQSLDNFWRDCAAAGADRAAAEIPLYLESGWAGTENDVTLVGVACTCAERHRRLRERRGWSVEQCQDMDGWQWTEKRKLAACHMVVNNDTNEAALDQAAGELLSLLEKREAAQEEALAHELAALWA